MNKGNLRFRCLSLRNYAPERVRPACRAAHVQGEEAFQPDCLNFQELKFDKMEKRWGGCTYPNNIIFITEAAKLSFSLIDCTIIDVLPDTKVINQSKGNSQSY